MSSGTSKAKRAREVWQHKEMKLLNDVIERTDLLKRLLAAWETDRAALGPLFDEVKECLRWAASRS